MALSACRPEVTRINGIPELIVLRLEELVHHRLVLRLKL
jgi:hypothetical protein